MRNIFFVAFFCCQYIAVWTQQNNETLLREFLFENYDKNTRPVLNHAERLDVFLTLSLMSIVEVNAHGHYLKSRVYFELEWVDKFLGWTKSNYTDIDVIMVDAKTVWKPDLGIKNSLEGFEPLSTSKNLVGINKNGLVYFSPYGTFDTLCKISAKRFPFDTQRCSIDIIPWLTDPTMQYMRLGYDDVMTDVVHTSSEWDLIDTSAECVDTFELGKHICKFTLVLRRKPAYFILHLVCPAILLSLMTPFVFILPPSSGEKVSFSVAIFLSYSLFQTTLKENMPVTSEFSIIAFFIQFHFILGGVQTVISVILMRLGANEGNKEVTRFPLLASLVLRCKRQPERKSNKISCMTNQLPEEEQEAKKCTRDKNITWGDVTYVIDNILFCLFFSIAVVMVLGLVIFLLSD